MPHAWSVILPFVFVDFEGHWRWVLADLVPVKLVTGSFLTEKTQFIFSELLD